MEYDALFKILLVGDSGVGKTSMITMFTEPSAVWDPNFVSTIGVDFKVNTVHRPNNKTVKLQIWDTAGQERFRGIISSYYRGAHGIILVYDVTDIETLRHISTVWMNEIQKYANPEAKMVLVGNKTDLATSFSLRSVRSLAKQMMENSNGAIIASLETSAKMRSNIDSAFLYLVDGLLASYSVLNSSHQTKKDTFKLRPGIPVQLHPSSSSSCSC